MTTGQPGLHAIVDAYVVAIEIHMCVADQQAQRFTAAVETQFHALRPAVAQGFHHSAISAPPAEVLAHGRQMQWHVMEYSKDAALPQVLDERGEVDRKKVGGIVFADPRERRALEAMVFPWIERRLKGEPPQYITGRAAFRGLDLAVTHAVLIPRPETEGLVEAVLEVLRADAGHWPTPRVLDLGTGSGAIALAIASEWPSARVTATRAFGLLVATSVIPSGPRLRTSSWSALRRIFRRRAIIWSSASRRSSPPRSPSVSAISRA